MVSESNASCVYMHMYMYVCMHGCMYVCMHACMHAESCGTCRMPLHRFLAYVQQ